MRLRRGSLPAVVWRRARPVVSTCRTWNAETITAHCNGIRVGESRIGIETCGCKTSVSVLRAGRDELVNDWTMNAR
jgi:hypothetical protein